jgi:hypothetical protein
MGVPLQPLAFVILVVLLGFPGIATAAVATGEMYRGLLLPDSRTPPIPITVELDLSLPQHLSGHVSTSPPLTGEGRVLSGEKKGYQCNFKSDLGAARAFSFEGFCLTDALEGKYTLRMAEGTLLKGETRLVRVDAEERKSKTDPEERLDQFPRSVTHCISANTACLAACPRGDYNAAFVCSNRCRLRFTSCKAAATVPSPPDTAR